MAKIQQYHSTQQTSSQVVPQVRAPNRVPGHVGRGLIDLGRGVEALGKGIQKGRDERQDANDNTVIASAVNDFNRWNFLEYVEMEKRAFDKPDDFEKAEEDYLKRRGKHLGKLVNKQNPNVTARVKMYGDSSEVADRMKYHQLVFEKQQQFNMAEFSRIWGDKFEQFVDQPNRLTAELKMHIEQYKPWLNPVYAQKLEASIATEISKYQKQKQVEDIHEAAGQMDYEDAIGFLNDVKGIEKEDRNDLIARRKRQQEIETASRNDTKYWEAYRSIINEPEAWPDERLGELIRPDSITADDAVKLTKVRDDENDPSKTTDAKRGFDTLNELKTLHKQALKDEEPDEGETEEEHIRKGVLLFRGHEYDFERWLNEKPRSSEEIEKKIKIITAPVQEKIVLNWWERFTAGYDPAERKALVEKKIKVLGEKGHWEKLTEAERKDVRAGFEKGASVQDVLDLINAD